MLIHGLLSVNVVYTEKMNVSSAKSVHGSHGNNYGKNINSNIRQLR